MDEKTLQTYRGVRGSQIQGWIDHHREVIQLLQSVLDQRKELGLDEFGHKEGN